MPELPEVEVHRRHLAVWLTGRRVADVRVGRARMLAPSTPSLLAERLHGAVLTMPQRVGKHLCCGVEAGGALYAHLGMSGLWRRADRAACDTRSLLALTMDDGSCVELLDPRRLSTLGWLHRGLQDPHAPFATLGPDLLNHAWTGARLCARVAHGRAPLKSALLDQTRVAGLGNIHAAEALWLAQLSPFMPARNLTPDDATRLLKGIEQSFCAVLDADDGAGITYVQHKNASNPFHIYRRRGRPCPRCAQPIERTTQAGRGTYFCPRCQPAPRL